MKIIRIIFGYLLPFLCVLVLYCFCGGVFYLGPLMMVLGLYQFISAIVRIINTSRSNKQLPKALKYYLILTGSYIGGLGCFSYYMALQTPSKHLGSSLMVYLSSASLLASFYLLEVVYPTKQKTN
jgi:hypothetical protein